MLLTLVSSDWPNLDILLSLFDDMHKSTDIAISKENPPHSGGRRLWVGRLATQSTQLVQNKSKKNEATAGVALVAAAVTDFTMYAGHQFLGEEDVDLTPLSAPVPDRQTPSSPDTA